MHLIDIHWWLYRFWCYRRLSWWCNPKTYYLYARSWYRNYKTGRLLKRVDRIIDKLEREKS